MGVQLPVYARRKHEHSVAQRVTEPTLPYIREVLTPSKIQKQSFRILKQSAKAEAFASVRGSASCSARKTFREKFFLTFQKLSGF